MKVSYSEGVAIDTGPESCTFVRKGEGEARHPRGQVFTFAVLLKICDD